MQNLLERIGKHLASALRPEVRPRRARTYECRCGRTVFFRNSICLACETPLVACQNPGFLVSRHGIYTGRFDGSGMDSLGPFSEALQTLFENPDRRRDLGASGRAWTEATHTRARFLESFARLCERAGAPR